MIVQFRDTNAGTPVYINPTYIVTFRPAPEDPHRATILRLSDGEVITVKGEHTEVANKIDRRP